MHKVYLRADGSKTIGYGHVHRILSLAQMLYKNFDCIFVSHDEPEFLKHELQKLSIPFVKVENIGYKFTDERKVGDEIAFDMEAILQGNEIVVLDGYWFGRNYQQAIKNKGCILVYVDDLAEEETIADVLINHSLGVSRDDYKKISLSTSLYLGSQYSLINVQEKFRRSKIYQSPFDQLLIAMGGADPLNFSCKIFEEYEAFIKKFEKVIVVAGNGYEYLQRLQESVKRISSVEILQCVPKEEVFAIMHSSTTAILSASTMAIEYAHIGGALAVIQTAANQHLLYKGLVENEVALPINEMITASETQIEKLQINQRKIFSGGSNERYNKLFSELQIQASLSFIKASKAHVNITYQWAADPVIRAYSFNQHKISLQEHTKWYFKKIEQLNCIYLLGKWDNLFVGSLRFDITDTTALISYMVDPQFHGKGLGRIMLAKGLDYLTRNYSNITGTTGYVMGDNIASVKVFERLGFTAEIQNNHILFKKKVN